MLKVVANMNASASAGEMTAVIAAPSIAVSAFAVFAKNAASMSECAEDGLLGKCTADECHERLPAHAEEASDRFDERSYTVEQAVVNIAVPAE